MNWSELPAHPSASTAASPPVPHRDPHSRLAHQAGAAHWPAPASLVVEEQYQTSAGAS